jgi:GNAT superfamily N-acetyltransferase
MSFALSAKAVPLPPPPRLLARSRGVSFHEERFSWLQHEAGGLFHAHWAEASADLSQPLAVNWGLYERLEQANLEVCVVARHEAVPVGYAVYIVQPHLHYDLVIADNDLFYLDPAYRYGWLGVKLFTLAEQLLRERGVNEVINRCKLHVKPGRGGRDVGGIFRLLGYRPIETLYRKKL